MDFVACMVGHPGQLMGQALVGPHCLHNDVFCLYHRAAHVLELVVSRIDLRGAWVQ